MAIRACCNAHVRRRHRFEAHRATFEHGLQSIDAAIALPQTLGPAKAVGRAVVHAELFEAEPATRRALGEPKLFASGSALRAAKVGQRAAVWELRMSHADELGLLAERYDGPLVLKPNHARGPKAGNADANKFIEEDAAVRIDRAFWHELKVTPR